MPVRRAGQPPDRSAREVSQRRHAPPLPAKHLSSVTVTRLTDEPDFRVGPSSDPDRYKLGPIVGSGAEGILYRGWITTAGGVVLEVAIKMLQPNLLSNFGEWQVRWGEQVELLRSLHLPGIVPVRDGFDGPLPHPKGASGGGTGLYLVMNWIAGEPLDRWIQHRSERDPFSDLAVLTPVATALDAMHSGALTGGIPIVHRDIKPANILVTGERAVLVDFGLIQGLLPEEPVSSAVGTPGYLAPEMRDGGRLTAAADKFSFGLVAYFLLTGTEPSRDRDSPSGFDLQGPLTAGGKGALVDAFVEILSPDPDCRPSSLTDWLEGLTALRPGAGGSVPSPRSRRGLPVHVSSFVGRERELEHLSRLFLDSRLVTVVGPGGSGKTRLATEAVARHGGADVVFVDLAALDEPSLVERTIGASLGINLDRPDDLSELVADAIGESSLVCLIDNCEHVIDACAAAVDAILRGTPNLRVLATSREPLSIDGETVFRLVGLELPAENSPPSEAAESEAVRLFLERARAQQTELPADESTARLVVSVCRHLDGLPLALELAAPRLRSMSLADLEARLVERSDLLSVKRRAGLPRHQTLTSLIDWSYELLDAGEQQAFLRLSVFPSSFDFEAAELSCDLGENGVPFAQVLASLVDKSLVQVVGSGGSVRYRLLETIREYGIERLRRREGAEDAARDAHALVFHQLSRRWLAIVDDERQQVLQWTERERDNLRAATLRLIASSPGRVSEALRLAQFFVWHCHSTWRYAEGIEMAQAALRCEGGEDDPNRTMCQIGLSQIYMDLGYLRLAREALDAALESAPRTVTDQEEVFVLLREMSAQAAYRAGDYPSAIEFANSALSLCAEPPEQSSKAWYQILRAQGLEFRGLALATSDPSAAHEDLLEAARLFRSAEVFPQVVEVLLELALSEARGGNMDQAADFLEEVDEVLLSTELKDIRVLQRHALARWLMGDVPRAASYAEQAMALSKEQGLSISDPLSLLLGALCASAAGETDSACLLHGAAELALSEQETKLELLEAATRLRDRSRLAQLLGVEQCEDHFRSGAALSRRRALDLASEILSRLAER